MTERRAHRRGTPRPGALNCTNAAVHRCTSVSYVSSVQRRVHHQALAAWMCNTDQHRQSVVPPYTPWVTSVDHRLVQFGNIRAQSLGVPNSTLPYTVG